MSFLYFIRLIIKNLKWLVIIPLVLAVTIFYFTRKEKKVYSSESIVYTGIASGYSLSGAIKADYFGTSNAFDNLISVIESRETKEEVAISLLSEHLFMKKHDPNLITWGAYDELQKLIPESVRKDVVKPTLEETRKAVVDYMSKSEDNVIYKLINSDNHYYSVDVLNSKAKPSRISNSDLIKISYEANDPFICKRTIELLEETFMQKHRELKQVQTQSAVEYFETETKKAFARLDSAERLFLAFNKDNDIINYYEQTKAVAGEKEDLYAMEHNLQMDKMASSSSLAKVNENIKGQAYQALYGSDVLKEREKLSDIYGKIAMNEVLNKKAENKAQTDSLRIIANRLEKKLKTSLDNLYIESNTPNGIPTKTVLDEWLKTTLAFEQSKARLAVMDKRKEEFQQEYRKFAPLGAMLKKIERFIAISEQEYLELLRNLNTAKLNQQNTELTAKLKVVDPPYLPLKANASKRPVLIAVGFLVGFVLVLAFVLTQALINKTLMAPQRAKGIVDLPLLGVYPLLNENSTFLEKANLRLMQQFLAVTDLSVKPVTIGLISTQKSEGKSTIAYLMAKELSDLDYSVETHTWNNSYDLRESLNSDFSIIEFPPLENMVIKPESFPRLNSTILLCRANRIWTKIDKDMIDVFIKTTGNKPYFILNGVDINFAEEYIGEVPKKRNVIRAFIKRVVKFEFGNRGAINREAAQKKNRMTEHFVSPPKKTKPNAVVLSGIITGVFLTVLALYMYFSSKKADNTPPEPNIQKPILNEMPQDSTSMDTAKKNVYNGTQAVNGRFFVVAGTFSTEDNAKIYIEELKKEGFQNALIIPVKKAGTSVKVAYSVFDTELKAIKESQEINRKFDKKSWVYTYK